MKGKRLSFKFQNNTVDNGLLLLDFQCRLSVLGGRNDPYSLNITGNRLSLKFQNNTASETFLLQDGIIYWKVYENR